jgi:adenine phosphoribosyltransferase
LDIFPVFRDPAAFEVLITNLLNHLTSHTIPALQGSKIDVVVGLDARGFLLGSIIASKLKAAFVPSRKQGKLPGECVTAEYAKEYGKVRYFFWRVFTRLVVGWY